MLVLRRVHGAETGQRHDQPARGDALRRLQQLERLEVARLGRRIVGEVVLRRAQVVVRDRHLVVLVGAGLGEFHDFLGERQRLVEARRFVIRAELLVCVELRVQRQDAGRRTRCGGRRLGGRRRRGFLLGEGGFGG